MLTAVIPWSVMRPDIFVVMGTVGYRDEARQMFFDGYDNYLQHAFPKVVSPLRAKLVLFD